MDATTPSPIELTALDQKALRLMGDRVVLKPLTRWNEAYREFPRYVMEYLAARYIDPANPVPGQHRIDLLLAEHYVESDARELIKSRIKEKGEYVLLGSLQLRLDAARDHYWAEVPALGDSFVRVSRKVLGDYGDVLLTGGAWGTMTVEYDATYELKGKIYPFFVRDFQPFQITRLDLEDYIDKRRQFTAEEWVDLLVTSIGFNPTRYTAREKLLMLLRLVPFVEANYNLIELGPRETGKTYTYRNTSSRSFVISGGTATPATLFYNQASRKIGILGYRDVIFFDEIANTRFGDPEATISVLKDYMQTGRFSRGPHEFSSQASIVLGGNIDTDLERRCPVDRYEHLFEVLPEDLQDTAFLDRIHAYLPGWGLPKIQPANYAMGYGFITDYLAEIFTRLRRLNFQTHVNARRDFSVLTGRNQDAVRKTTAGLLKLVYPHRTVDDLEESELAPCLALACEARERVIEQLARMPAGRAEFKAIRFELPQRV
ncbi:MAG TPA: BREX system Lon protease-like protein BrxL [Anaerolineae bacterium]|nr:BREX system Lon protease-like protein BrxL [Anaerolineae bacterium]HOQ98907.1 BREX system Lon protease-like protein BrxL [Anaerolineae bacterium]HPL29169.1 BREX system Lon protease-like protein BrxL [Anaerolineae bacterium]